jgi:hypothetical protein
MENAKIIFPACTYKNPKSEAQVTSIIRMLDCPNNEKRSFQQTKFDASLP